jgi:hypothetical protein
LCPLPLAVAEQSSCRGLGGSRDCEWVQGWRVGRRRDICFGGAGTLRLATRRRACSSVASGSLLCQLDERERRRVARACLRAFSGCVAVRARRLTPRTGTPTVLWRSFCTGPISLPSDAGASIDEGDRVVKANHEQRAGLDTRRTEERDGGGPVLRRARSRGRVTKRAITAGGAPSVRSTRPSRLVAGPPRRCLRCPVIRRWRGSRR